MADVNLQDMIGVRKDKNGERQYPKLTVSGHNYRLPAVRIRLSDKHFCIKDDFLSQSELDERIKALKALVSSSPKASRSSTPKVSDES